LSPDLGNALFEAGGAVTAWLNALQLYRDKEIKGVYWPIYFFYTAWGFWNLYYYPALGQWFSFFAGAVLVLGNFAWITQAVRLWGRARDRS
jgi:hypothetical protein